MTLKEMLGFAAPVLTGGAVIILGFLSFSGIYVLLPILSVCILGFFLSVGFEGTVYYENIKNSLEKLFRPNYLKRQLAHECLRELATKIELCVNLKHIINTLKSQQDSPSLSEDYAAFLDLFEKFTERDDPEFKKKLEDNIFSLDYFDEEIKDQKRLPGISFASNASKQAIKKRKVMAEKLDILLIYLEGDKHDIHPFFFDDFTKLTKIHHKYDKPRLNEGDQKEKDALEESINRLKRLFRKQLFPDNNDLKIDMIGECLEVVATVSDAYKYTNCDYVFIEENGYIYKKNDNKTQLDESGWLKLREKLSDLGRKSLDELIYVNQLRRYLDSYRDKWQTKIEERSFLFTLAKVASTLAGVFMILGTTFLLVEAFAVLPFISLIPLGFWPILIMPMAVIAGLAFGMLTYNAITDMINNDIILKRYYKIKADIKKGITFSTGLMIAATVFLLAITIALTVCTAGTWWTVIKHTRPLFIWMGKIPSVLIGIISATLGFAALMFNWTNSDQTLTEFSEMDLTAKPHPYDLTLSIAKESDGLPNLSDYKPTLCKKGNEYWFYGSIDEKTWAWTKVNGAFLNSIDFKSSTLPYSITNLAIYLTIIINRAHTFIPNKETWLQTFNPFRILLIFSYTPLLVLLFIGHLISDSATFDRLPSVDELISMAVGFCSDFSEDFTYIFSLDHRHKDDIGSLMDELASEGHNHDDNLPAWALRKLFYPLFYLAAWWHVAMSQEKNNSLLNYANMYIGQDVTDSFADALEKMQNIRPAEEAELSKKELECVEKILHGSEETTDVIKVLATEAKTRSLLLQTNTISERGFWAVGCSGKSCNHRGDNIRYAAVHI